MYLDRVCGDRLSTTLNFARVHVGHVANAGGRLITNNSSPTSSGRSEGAIFEVGGVENTYGGADERFAPMMQQQQHSIAVRRLNQSHSVPLLIQDPPAQQPSKTPAWTAAPMTSNDADWPPL